MNSAVSKNASEENAFFKIPKALLTSEKYKALSAEAKLLYALMYSRRNISEMNDWTDSSGRVYIYFTVREITEVLGCGHTKAAKLLDELDIRGGAGLIERKKQGLCKPSKIFIYNVCSEEECGNKNFDSEKSAGANVENTVDNRVDTMVDDAADSNAQGITSKVYDNIQNENSDCYPDKYVDKGVEINVNKITPYPETDVRTSEIRSSGIPQNGTSDTRNAESNYTEDNKINNNYTDLIISDPVVSDMEQEENTDMTGWIEKRSFIKNTIKANIDYTVAAHTFGERWASEIVELMTEVVCSKDKYIRINKANYPQEAVAERFMDIRYAHIENLYFTMQNTTHSIGNIRAYMITAIYRSFETSESWMKARVNYDLLNKS